MKGWTEELAAGPAAGLVVNLEDLWLEPEPQNKPGTGPEEANWRRRTQLAWPEIVADPDIEGWLGRLSDLRKGA